MSEASHVDPGKSKPPLHPLIAIAAVFGIGGAIAGMIVAVVTVVRFFS
jgi:hypothetical protein